MVSFETALRLAVVGQALLIAGVFVFGKGNISARLSGAFLLIGVSAYLLVSSPVLREAFAFLMPFLTLFAIMVPHCLWSFARGVFEAPWPSLWLTGGFVVLAVGAWIIFLGEDSHSSELSKVANTAIRVASLVIVGHALLMAARGRPDDLVEQRRVFRGIFIAVVAVEVGAVVAVELILGEAVPTWLALLNVAVISVLAFALAIPMLRLDPEFFAPAMAYDRARASGDEDTPSPSELVLKDSLLAAMGRGAYRQSGLTIRALAEQLSHPEHQLRKLINGRLGFRNFSAFLNSYRIPEAMRILADPGEVRKPVLTIALDLGYGSLGPFNRAFKAATGSTPTEFRRRAVRSASAESE